MSVGSSAMRAMFQLSRDWGSSHGAVVTSFAIINLSDDLGHKGPKAGVLDPGRRLKHVSRVD